VVTVVQPIIDVANGTVMGAEALSRFPNLPDANVEEVFAAAHMVGSGFALEAACLEAALTARGSLPSGVRLFTNLSPDVLCHPAIARCWPADLDGVVVEATEQSATYPDRFVAECDRLRRRGALIAVDDVNSGYAGLLRLATIRPDYVKIDRAVVTKMLESDAQTAVLETLVEFSHRLGAAVIGEGVETLSDLATLSEFDVDFAQGWAIGRPAPALPAIPRLVIDTCVDERRNVLGKLNGHGRQAEVLRRIYAATAAVDSATNLGEISIALTRIAEAIDVDTIGLSALTPAGTLVEVASSEHSVDSTVYALADYPATMQALNADQTLEVHLHDQNADPAERACLAELGYASLLLAPVPGPDGPLGVLEFVHQTPRRWSTVDIAHARGLADHLGAALRPT
jgi:EAL domain-containing protein (putative c-di-GMP-specific phosphodiesterase class I)